MNERELLMRATAILRDKGIEEAPREARLLWRATGDLADFDALIARRAAREPMSHLLGYRDFYKHRFAIDARALDPRPDTEALVEAALAGSFTRMLDLGTGSGCILLSLLAERPAATGIGTELSERALELARQNRAALGLERRAELILSDWFTKVTGPFDLIVSNPPYIAANEMEHLGPELGFEPRMALTDEGDGLSAYRAITEGAGGHLTPGGRLIVEIGWRQGPDVAALFKEEGFDQIAILPDLDGRDRVISGIWPE